MMIMNVVGCIGISRKMTYVDTILVSTCFAGTEL